MKTFILVFIYFSGRLCSMLEFVDKETYNKKFDSIEEASFYVYNRNKDGRCGYIEGKLYELDITTAGITAKEVKIKKVEFGEEVK